METLYRSKPALTGSSLDLLQTGQSRFFEPVKGLAESGAMTALCLMDALCDFEHSAGHRRGRVEAGDSHEPEPAADLGDLIGDLRSEQGSFQTRQDVLDMVSAVDRAWDRVNADDACDGHICFDFEFCPEAIRLRFEKGLTGADLEDALTDLGRDMVEAQEARFAARAAELHRIKNADAARAALAQAQAAVEEATRRLEALTA